MALSIRNSEVELLARELASQSGAGMTDEILAALRERKARLSRESEVRLKKIRSIAARCAALPLLDGRSADEILGYSDSGTFS